MYRFHSAAVSTMHTATYSWSICLWLFLGTSVLGHRRIVKRQQETSSDNSCSVEEFKCSNGKCIDEATVCDGLANCSDGSDETQSLCTRLFNTCPSYSFRCKYGACVDKNYKCDGKKDCVDGSDEVLSECKNTTLHTTSSTCKSDEFKCKSGECIDSTSTCDGSRDCRDGSDEITALCKGVQCPAFTFKCRYGACISKTNKCNGAKNCADGSDEDGCPSNTPKPIKVTTSPTITFSTTQLSLSFNSRNMCILPSIEGNLYFMNSNPTVVLSHGSHVEDLTKVEVTCMEGYYKSSSLDLSMVCLEGKWSSTYTNLCLKRCQPITSDSLDITCTLNGNFADCSKPAVPGTKLTPRCKSTHELPNGGRETPIVLHCRDNGAWTGGQLYSCQAKCGQEYTKSKKLIVHGTNSTYGSAPWNVGIYKRNNDDRNYEMICGGSLISSNLVVSAAHCFWEDGQTDRTLTNLGGLYKIAAGKYSRDINVLDGIFTDIIDLKTIYIKETFNGVNGLYREDIAVLVLQSKLQISVVVSPVCMYWESNKNLYIQNGELGKVVGWGHTENKVPSTILLETKLPYIDRKTCQNAIGAHYTKYLTIDKFCAGSNSGIGGVDQGDSGAGITFVHDNSHFLGGVVSNKDPTAKNSIALFTDVRSHISWITEFYQNYSNEENENRMLLRMSGN